MKVHSNPHRLKTTHANGQIYEHSPVFLALAFGRSPVAYLLRYRLGYLAVSRAALGPLKEHAPPTRGVLASKSNEGVTQTATHTNGPPLRVTGSACKRT